MSVLTIIVMSVSNGEEPALKASCGSEDTNRLWLRSADYSSAMNELYDFDKYPQQGLRTRQPLCQRRTHSTLLFRYGS